MQVENCLVSARGPAGGVVKALRQIPLLDLFIGEGKGGGRGEEEGWLKGGRRG